MLWQRIRIALLTGALVAMTGLSAFGDEENKDKKAEPIGPPAGVAPAATPCPPKTCIVWVNEMVQEQYPCTRTVYDKVCKTEEYTAYKTECYQEPRTRTVTCYKQVCETVNVADRLRARQRVRGADGHEELHRLQAGHARHPQV